MKKAMMMLAALALTAGVAAEQGDTQSPTQATNGQAIQDRGGTGARTDLGAPRNDKSGTDQTYNTGATVANVGKDNPDTYKPMNANADVERGNGTRGTGVATGFVAAGIGLALLGLFVRRRHHHGYGDYDAEDRHDRPGGPSNTGGVGPRL